MKTFVELDIPDCEQINLPDRRIYRTPEGKDYPSVTTVLSILPKPELNEWVLKVGPDEAARISKRAAESGTKLHEACENYLLDRTTKWTMFDLNAKDMYTQCLPILKRIDNIYALERRLYSTRLEVAGSVDLIAELDGELSVMDWKSSSRLKSKEEIPNYFMQCACYAYMFWERTGIVVKKIKILMSVHGHGMLIFEENVSDWIKNFIVTREQFRELRGF